MREDDLEADELVAFFLVAAFTGKTPADRDLGWPDIVIDVEVEVRQ